MRLALVYSTKNALHLTRVDKTQRNQFCVAKHVLSSASLHSLLEIIDSPNGSKTNFPIEASGNEVEAAASKK
jgi:hypothetical protein